MPVCFFGFPGRSLQIRPHHEIEHLVSLSLSLCSFLVGTWLPGILISSIKITFENSSSHNLLMDVCKSGGRMTSNAICEAMRVTTFSVSGKCMTHIYSEHTSRRKTTLSSHTLLKKICSLVGFTGDIIKPCHVP